jgi:hypothetical protein
LPAATADIPRYTAKAATFAKEKLVPKDIADVWANRVTGPFNEGYEKYVTPRTSHLPSWNAGYGPKLARSNQDITPLGTIPPTQVQGMFRYVRVVVLCFLLLLIANEMINALIGFAPVEVFFARLNGEDAPVSPDHTFFTAWCDEVGAVFTPPTEAKGSNNVGNLLIYYVRCAATLFLWGFYITLYLQATQKSYCYTTKSMVYTYGLSNNMYFPVAYLTPQNLAHIVVPFFEAEIFYQAAYASVNMLLQALGMTVKSIGNGDVNEISKGLEEIVDTTKNYGETLWEHTMTTRAMVRKHIRSNLKMGGALNDGTAFFQ